MNDKIKSEWKTGKSPEKLFYWFEFISFILSTHLAFISKCFSKLFRVFMINKRLTFEMPDDPLGWIIISVFRTKVDRDRAQKNSHKSEEIIDVKPTMNVSSRIKCKWIVCQTTHIDHDDIDNDCIMRVDGNSKYRRRMATTSHRSFSFFLSFYIFAALSPFVLLSSHGTFIRCVCLSPSLSWLLLLFFSVLYFYLRRNFQHTTPNDA